MITTRHRPLAAAAAERAWADHRGQIMLRARELGHEFSTEDIMRIWGWKKMPVR
jgi:hypothetical protein